ncbi:DUF4168 domain-containing protein [Orrella sp. JC864]|uniref:DUF4168 domain-containing protein n=1 Tax=Orrella sp. JC864 TaxID=3120298 RepID=UPI00300B79C9
MKRSTKAALSAFLLTAGLASGAAMAQAAAPAPQPAQVQPITSPSDAQLEKFAAASQKVAMVANEYQPRFDSATDDASRQQILQEADAKMVELVRADGLTVEEFNGIGQAVQQDPQLRERVMQKLDNAPAVQQ